MTRSSTGFLLICAGAALIVLGLLVSTGALAWSGRLPGDIRVEREGDSCFVRIREARADEHLARERNPLLGAPINANDAPGPGSVRAVVRGGRPPFIYLVDTTRSTSRRLCPGSQPRFSPDGRSIACDRWLSSDRPNVLALVNAQSGKTSTFEHLGQIEDYAWSPDSRHLAFASVAHDSSWHFDVGCIDVGTGAVQVLASDSDANVEWYGIEWAPDNRRFLAVRHREDEHDDSLYAADLWLLDLESAPCRLTHSPRQDEDFAGWIDDARIRYESPGGRRFVIELGPGPRHH